MTYDVESVSFPALRVNEKHISIVRSKRELNEVSENDLGRRFLTVGTRYHDSLGRVLEVSDFSKTRRSLSWRYWGRKHAVWVIDLDFVFIDQLTLADTTARLLQLIKQKGWAGQADATIDQLAREYSTCQSHAELYESIVWFGPFR